MITIRFNETDVHYVKRMLRGVEEAVPRVLSRAINDTLSGVKTDASAAIREVITAKKGAVDGTLRTVKATVAHLSAMVSSSGPPLPLIEFAARQTKAGVSVQVKRKNPRSVLKGAFIATMKGGHKGVFWREYHQNAKRPVRKIAYSKLPKKYRLPIKQRFGPRIPDIFGDDPVMNVVLEKADGRLHKNVERELNYELSKL